MRYKLRVIALCGLEIDAEVGAKGAQSEEQNRHEEGGQQIDGLAVLDMQNAQAGSGDENAADERHFGDEFVRDERLREQRYAVD